MQLLLPSANYDQVMSITRSKANRVKYTFVNNIIIIFRLVDFIFNYLIIGLLFD